MWSGALHVGVRLFLVIRGPWRLSAKPWRNTLQLLAWSRRAWSIRWFREYLVAVDASGVDPQQDGDAVSGARRATSGAGTPAPRLRVMPLCRREAEACRVSGPGVTVLTCLRTIRLALKASLARG